MDPAAVARSPCGGLRAALLRGGGASLPPDPAPLRPLARELGATVREIDAYCRTLAQEGVLDGVHVEWAPTLPRVRWRGLATGHAVHAVRAALRELPGVTGCDEAEDGEAGPALWFDIAARGPEAASQQAAALQRAAGPLQWLPCEHAHCTPAACRGPCTDPALAAACEAAPMPLSTHPFRPLAAASARPEREVLATLRRWQRQGQVAHIGLALAHAPQSRACTARWCEGAAAAAAAATLRAQAGVSDLVLLPDGRAALVAEGRAPEAAALLARALAAGGLRAGTAFALQRTRWRSGPRLFAP